MSSERQAEGERWAQIRAARGIQMASGNQATKPGYRHRVRDVPRGTAVTTTQKCVPPHVRTRKALPQARPMTGRRRLESYGTMVLDEAGKPVRDPLTRRRRRTATTVGELTGPQARRYRAKMNRQVNRTSGIARTLRGREVHERERVPQPAQPESLVAAAETKGLLKRLNEVWRRSR